MASSFETSPSHSSTYQQPIQVATRKEYIFSSAKEMVADMKGWVLDQTDEENTTLHCTKKGGALGGTSTITVIVAGSEEHPSTTVNCKVQVEGGLMARPQKTAEEFMKLFFRRIC
ncbi:MAG: carbon monoxide dehydrogenase subunit G [Bacteroidia bacterium]|jgi:carbon monoxide dehydrogenase subunit G